MTVRISHACAGVLQYDLGRSYYFAVLILVAVFIALTSAVLWMYRPPAFVAIPFALGLFALVGAFLSFFRILFLKNPVLRIDSEGILDKRLTRQAVPWNKIKGLLLIGQLYPIPPSRPLIPVAAAGIKIEVGNRRAAGIALAPWSFFAGPRWGLVGWDDLVIGLYGLRGNRAESLEDKGSRIIWHGTVFLQAQRGQGAKTQPTANHVA